jgi:hypothetical protein
MRPKDPTEMGRHCSPCSRWARYPVIIIIYLRSIDGRTSPMCDGFPVKLGQGGSFPIRSLFVVGLLVINGCPSSNTHGVSQSSYCHEKTKRSLQRPTTQPPT